MKKGLIKFCAYMLTSLALVVECISTQAAESEEANYENAKEGVVQVNTVFVDANNEKHIICGGTGFIVGNSEETEYVITCNHIVNPDEETKEAAYTYLEIDNTDNAWENIDLSIEVVVEGDMVISASILNSSSDLDMAILQLEQPIYTRAPLTILTSENYEVDDLPYAIADVVYALGYPDGISYDSEVQYYSTEQVAMTAGSIVNLTSLNGVQVIENEATVDNNCGGPLVDENGYVIGMNLLTKDGIYSCALDSTKITKVLDSLGIEYNKEYEKPEKSAEEIEASQDVEETEKTFPVYLLIIICVGIVTVIAGVVTVITVLVLHKDNKPAKKSKKQIRREEEAEIQKFVNTPNIAEKKSGNEFIIEKSVDTTILSGSNSMNETSVLGSSMSTSAILKIGSLIRLKNNEKISVNKPYFTIGKDSLHVDYCIHDNGTISRQHAVIRKLPDGVYLEDCNSTNGSYVNGTKLPKGGKQKLSGGDVIKISNEEFRYEL